MKLIFNIDPVAKGRPRFSTYRGTPRAYTPAKTRTFEKTIRTLARQQWTAPALSGALHVSILFYVPIKNKKLWGKPHDKRPDVDNYAKGVSDALNGIIFSDDGQIATLEVRKQYAEHGRIELFIYPIYLR